jgi:hypothetical protein
VAKPFAPAEIWVREGPLKPILARLQQHAALLRQVRSALPPKLAEHCLACVPRPDRLLIYVDSAAWATQLRFQLPQVLELLRAQSGIHFRRADARLIPAVQPRENRRDIPIPSRETAKAMQDQAGHAATGELRDSLTRLAKTLAGASR